MRCQAAKEPNICSYLIFMFPQGWKYKLSFSDRAQGWSGAVQLKHTCQTMFVLWLPLITKRWMIKHTVASVSATLLLWFTPHANFVEMHFEGLILTWVITWLWVSPLLCSWLKYLSSHWMVCLSDDIHNAQRIKPTGFHKTLSFLILPCCCEHVSTLTLESEDVSTT